MHKNKKIKTLLTPLNQLPLWRKLLIVAAYIVIPITIIWLLDFILSSNNPGYSLILVGVLTVVYIAWILRNGLEIALLHSIGWIFTALASAFAYLVLLFGAIHVLSPDDYDPSVWFVGIFLVLIPTLIFGIVLCKFWRKPN